LRFSSPAQADGDSVRRQTALRDAWLRRNPHITLDTSLVDKGVSGFTGANRKNRKHALAAFLELVRRGRVAPGAHLIVENLDRLSREHPLEVMGLVGELVRAGIRVVQLEPEAVFTAGMDEGALCLLLLGSVRGHGESKRKSSLCGAAWKDKKQQARAGRTPYGKMCPAWLELDGDRYRVKEDAAAAVRQIFQWCAGGLGLFAILERLNTTGVRPIGRKGQWERSYVRKLLTSVAVRGIYQPHNGSRWPNRQPDGEPIDSFYPRIIDDKLWYAAQAAIVGRARRPGRPVAALANPFSGLLVSATDGGRLHVCGCRGHKYLVSANAIQKAPGAVWETFPLKPFITAVLSQLRELRADSLFADPGGAKVAELTGRLANVDKRLSAALARFDADPESPTWSDRVTQYDLEKRALVKELDAARREAANPLSASWAEAVELMAAEEPERLRAALMAAVEGVWVLIVPRGRTRLAAARVQFRGGDTHRDYLIYHRGAVGGAAGTRAAQTEVRSFAAVHAPDTLDLRRPRDAAKLAKVLESIDPAEWAGGG
jgi:DNA invertase Pin-like site-specific DNA recombinase